MSDEEDEDDFEVVADFTIPLSAFREPTNLELARFIAHQNRDLFANILTVLRDNDLLTGEEEMNELIGHTINTSNAIVQWWIDLVDDPEFAGIIALAQQAADEEDDDDEETD